MQLSIASKIATLAAASVLALSTSVYAADNSGKNSNDGSADSDNACAEGSGTTSTETNANCTTKE